jgi:hypothetical protein
MGWGIEYYSLAGLAMEESRKETDVGAGGDDAEWMDGRCGCVCVRLPGMDEWMPFGYGRIPCPRPRASVGSAAELSSPTSTPLSIESPPLAPIIPLAPSGFFSFPEEQNLFLDVIVNSGRGRGGFGSVLSRRPRQVCSPLAASARLPRFGIAV